MVADKCIVFVASVQDEFARPAKGAQDMPILGGVIGAEANFMYLDAAKRLSTDFDYAKPTGYGAMLAGGGGFTPANYTTREKDVELIENLILRMSEQQERGYTFGGKVAKGLLNLPTWMAEFAMTGGLASLGSVAAKNAGAKLIGRWATTKVGQIALRGAGWTGGAITRATLGLTPRIVEKGAQRQVQVQILGTDQDGWAW